MLGKYAKLVRHEIPCDAEKYVGQSGRTIEARCKEHQRYARLYQPEKSAVAEHSISMGHHINFSSTSMLYRTSGYLDHLVKEAIEIHLKKNNFNRLWLHIEPGLVTYNQHAIEQKQQDQTEHILDTDHQPSLSRH
jgi:hypothetical protein